MSINFRDIYWKIQIQIEILVRISELIKWPSFMQTFYISIGRGYFYSVCLSSLHRLTWIYESIVFGQPIMCCARKRFCAHTMQHNSPYPNRLFANALISNWHFKQINSVLTAKATTHTPSDSDCDFMAFGKSAKIINRSEAPNIRIIIVVIAFRFAKWIYAFWLLSIEDSSIFTGIPFNPMFSISVNPQFQLNYCACNNTENQLEIVISIENTQFNVYKYMST